MLAPLDSATRLLNTANILYIVGAVFTALTAVWVLWETRAVALGRHVKHFLLSEILGAISAFICVLGSAGAIHFGNVVSHLKDVALAQYEKQADLKIAQAQQGMAIANQTAHQADLAAQETAKENAALRLDLQGHEAAEKVTDARLAKQNEETADFAHALAQQQANMTEQAKVSPVLSQSQVESLTLAVLPFSGAAVGLHMTSDTTVRRLGYAIQVALQKAGIYVQPNTIDMDSLYQGVSVAVHAPGDVPPIANVLVVALRNDGITVHTVAVPDKVPAGTVAVFIGPN